MHPCPGDETVSAYLTGDLDEPERAAVEGHLEDCVDCRALVTGLARAQLGEHAGHDRGADPMTGIMIGRYTLADLLGSGGMGLVYRAHDPVLERDVAIKLIHALDIRPADRERLLREARAMARLSHPNVLTVFDAGESGDELFIAMALVDGKTLREHCARARLTWREVVALCLGAARGLAASHRAGVLHRDVKPDNILVSRDGAVQVTDFGLARATTGSDGPVWPPSGSESGMAGTPGYLAPELRAGGEPTTASDQYSFCLTVKECLDRVPRRLERILRRGLAADPDRRYPSMDALAAALAAATARRWPLVAGLAAGALVAVVFGWALADRQDRTIADPPDRCGEPRARMDGLWNPVQRYWLRSAIAGLGLARGGLIGERLGARLDDHAERWITMRTELCHDTDAADADQAITARRIACLEDGFSELDKFLADLRAPDSPILRQVEWRSYGLTPPDRCSASAPLSLLPSPDPAVREEVARAQQALREAFVLADGGQLEAALASVRAVEATARRVDYLPLQAAALYDEAGLLLQTGDLAGARAKLEASAAVAEASGDDLRRAMALANLVVVVGVGYEDPEAALAYAARARPIVERLQVPVLEAELLRAEGQALLYKGDAAGSRDHLERALAVLERALVGDHDAIVATLAYLGSSTQQSGAWEAAEDYLRRAYEMAVRLHGEQHSTSAGFLKDWASGVLTWAEAADTPAERERLARLALAKADQAGATLDALLGAEHLESALARTTGCRALFVLRELDRAMSACERALAASRRAHGEGNPLLAAPLQLLGVVHHARGELGPARAALEEVLALPDPGSGDPARLAELQFDLAKILRDQGHSRRAIVLARAARPALAADARTGDALAELDAWLATRPR